MKIQIDGKEYMLWFRHDPPELFERETTCTIYDLDKKVFASGWALCVEEDNFKRSTGRQIALTRALKDFPRETRRQVWQQYWKFIKGS